MSTRLARLKDDKLAPIREVFDKINSSLQNSYYPGKNLTVDEHMIRYRGKCPLKQFLPCKPDKYGVKVFVLADSVTYYPCNLEIYLGKNSNLSQDPFNVVMRLCSILKPGHLLTGDNFFTSLRLANSLRETYKCYYLGTIRKIRREIPREIKDIKGVALNSSRFLYSPDNNSTLVSYHPKTNKNVLLLSNIHFDFLIPLENNPKSKPGIILDYNILKGGVDKMDQMIKEYRIYKAISRWPCVIFYDLVGTALLAAWVLYKIKFPDAECVKKKNRQTFIYELAKTLIAPSISIRQASNSFKYTHKSVKDNVKNCSDLSRESDKNEKDGSDSISVKK